MKKMNFMKVIEKYSEQVVRSLKSKGYDHGMAEDAVQDGIVSILENKSYTTLGYEAVDGRGYTFLKNAAKFKIADILKRQLVENETIVSITPHDESAPVAQTKSIHTKHQEAECDESMCPFCHVGELNMYKACASCHTIIGQGKAIRVKNTIDEKEISYLPEYDMSIDFAKALASLEPIEQTVIKAVVLNNDTQADVAAQLRVHQQHISRIYVEAKRKLQLALAEYYVSPKRR